MTVASENTKQIKKPHFFVCSNCGGNHLLCPYLVEKDIVENSSSRAMGI